MSRLQRTSDTDMGGLLSRFPETRYSAVVGIRDPQPGVRRRSYDAIIAAYWKPVYTYLRMRWRESNEDAKDLTQSIFARALESGTFANYDPSRSSFRTYLRLCADGHVLNDRKHRSRLKRGGEFPPMQLDGDLPSDESIELFFHREWVRSVFALAVGDIRSESLPFRIFERYDLGDSETRPTYAQLADEFSLSSATVTNYLSAMRRDFRKAVLGKLRELTATDREYRAEVRAILGIEI